MKVTRKGTKMKLPDPSEIEQGKEPEVESVKKFDIENVTEEELELLKYGLQSAFMMEQPVSTEIEAEDVEEMISEIKDALEDPEKKLKERIDDDRSIEEVMKERREEQ